MQERKLCRRHFLRAIYSCCCRLFRHIRCHFYRWKSFCFHTVLLYDLYFACDEHCVVPSVCIMISLFIFSLAPSSFCRFWGTISPFYSHISQCLSVRERFYRACFSLFNSSIWIFLESSSSTCKCTMLAATHGYPIGKKNYYIITIIRRWWNFFYFRAEQRPIALLIV